VFRQTGISPLFVVEIHHHLHFKQLVTTTNTALAFLPVLPAISRYYFHSIIAATTPFAAMAVAVGWLLLLPALAPVKVDSVHGAADFDNTGLKWHVLAYFTNIPWPRGQCAFCAVL
jgi:hypothetical protein